MLKHVVGIVSGGSSGLGAAAARHILRNGGRVVVADLVTSKEGFFQLASSAGIDRNQIYSTNGGANYTCVSNDDGDGNGGPTLAFCETDVTISDQVSAALDLAEDVFGGTVNAAISCAGIAPAKKTLSKDRSAPNVVDGKSQTSTWKAHPVDLFSRAWDVNVIGTFNLARLAAERMMKRDLGGKTDSSTTRDDEVDFSVTSLRGCIINTASIAAFEGQMGQVAYAASKGAIVGMTLPMARDLAPHGIRVMTIAPGLFLTPLLEGLPAHVKAELGASVPCPSRLGNPDEFGSLVGSILTNPMLNGSVIRLDGALRMPP